MGPELTALWRDEVPTRFLPAGPWSLGPGTVLEIGSGMGDALVAAAAHWELVIGVEVHARGLAATARAARTAGADNLRLVHGDAIEVLSRQAPAASLEEVHIWFPDPWPKARHRKRRLLRPAVADLLADRLAPGGTLRLATDIPDYADTARRVLLATGQLAPCGRGGVVPRPPWRPVTRYERTGLAAGREITDLAFRKR